MNPVNESNDQPLVFKAEVTVSALIVLGAIVVAAIISLLHRFIAPIPFW